MIISQETEEMLNNLLKEMFEGNAVLDNLCYNLQYNHFDNIANAMHEPVAHKLPEFADKISDFMNLMGARPVRYGMPDHITKYEKVEDILGEAFKLFAHLRVIVNKAISQADLEDETAETKIFLEDFLVNTLIPYCKQMDEWVAACKSLGEEVFNRQIDKYTHYIK